MSVKVCLKCILEGTLQWPEGTLTRRERVILQKKAGCFLKEEMKKVRKDGSADGFMKRERVPERCL